MVFKPLGIATDGLGAFCGFFIDILHKSFPGTFQTKRITIDLNKAVDEIDGRIMLLQPFNAIFIKYI